MSYIPPFTVSDEIMSLVAEIAEIIGHLSATMEQLPMPLLRKKNRIKTIQSSLAKNRKLYNTCLNGRLTEFDEVKCRAAAQY